MARTFTAFTDGIGEWWRPNDLFRFTNRPGGRLAFEPDPPERLVEIGPDGERFEVGPVTVWDPPYRLTFGWRQAGFPPDRSTEVSVRFETIGPGTRVTVEHVGWDAISAENAVRHGFPLEAFQQRLAEWWKTLLTSCDAHAKG